MVTSPRFRPVHCTAEHPCWECWQGFEPRVTSADIQEAWVETQRAVAERDTEFLSGAVWRISFLISKQWREMTRAPFNFSKPAPAAPAKTQPIDLDDLFKD